MSELPSVVVATEVTTSIKEYLRRHGPQRGGLTLDPDDSPVPLPSVRVPGYLDALLGSLAGHDSLPYAGNKAALERDLIYLAAKAMTDVVLKYEDDKDLATHKHIVQHEETFRRQQHLDSLRVDYAVDLAVASRALAVHVAVGDRRGAREKLEQMFYHLAMLPAEWHSKVLSLMRGVPEIVEAVRMIDDGVDEQVEGWKAMLDE